MLLEAPTTYEFAPHAVEDQLPPDVPREGTYIEFPLSGDNNTIALRSIVTNRGDFAFHFIPDAARSFRQITEVSTFITNTNAMWGRTSHHAMLHHTVNGHRGKEILLFPEHQQTIYYGDQPVATVTHRDFTVVELLDITSPLGIRIYSGDRLYCILQTTSADTLRIGIRDFSLWEDQNTHRPNPHASIQLDTQEVRLEPGRTAWRLIEREQVLFSARLLTPAVSKFK